MFFFDSLFLVLGVLLGLAFFTLLERKLLGYVHFRKGPTKIFFFGLLQPIGDAVKLFSKEIFKGYKMSFYFYIFAPFLGIFLMIVLWMSYSNFWGNFGSVLSILYVFCFLSLGVYFLLLSGWGSDSKYSLLGGYRSVSQTISYEVTMIFFALSLVYFMGFYDLFFLFFYQKGFWFFLLSIFFSLGWFFVCLAEANRTPFDFSEGESELVSGFNVDYGGGVFSLIFICEYGMIIFLCFLTVAFYLGGFSYLTKLLGLCFLFVWVRCCFPRYRYDFLMSSAWKLLLPFSLILLFLVSVVLFLFSMKDS